MSQQRKPFCQINVRNESTVLSFFNLERPRAPITLPWGVDRYSEEADNFGREIAEINGILFVSKISCMDCGVFHAPMYALRPPIWKELAATTSGRGVLCILCAEKRLGRSFVEADFLSTEAAEVEQIALETRALLAKSEVSDGTDG